MAGVAAYELHGAGWLVFALAVGTSAAAQSRARPYTADEDAAEGTGDVPCGVRTTP